MHDTGQNLNQSYIFLKRPVAQVQNDLSIHPADRVFANYVAAYIQKNKDCKLIHNYTQKE